MTEEEILIYGNKAQTKICEYAEIVEEQLRKGLDSQYELSMGIELLDFQMSLFDGINEWTDDEKFKWINFMIERHNIIDVPYIDFDPFFLPIVISDDAPPGTYVTHPELNTAVSIINLRIDGIEARVVALENLDYSDMIPQQLLDDVAEALATSQQNETDIDQLYINYNQLSADLADHIADDTIHVTQAEKDDWNNKVSQQELQDGLDTKAELEHTHPTSEVTGLDDALLELNNKIDNLPIPQDGEDGITPTISVGSVTSGPVPDVDINPGSTATSVIFDFVLAKGDDGEAFQFDAYGDLAGRDAYDSEDPGFKYLDIENGFYYVLEAPFNWSDPIPFRGQKGWSPIFGVYTVDATKKVLQLVDWFGGEGIEPATGYIGPSGLTNDTAIAVNIQGPAGAVGERFRIDAQGVDITVYDNELTGFTFLDTTDGKVYFKNSDVSGDWSAGFQWTGVGGGGGSVNWGDILGNILDQLDLIALANTKQPLDGDLTAIAGLTPGNDDIIQRKGGVWVSRTPAQYKVDLALTKADVGLPNVDDTSDVNKPVSTAQAAADAATLASANSYTDSKVVGVFNYRGTFDPTGGTNYPTTGGSGPAGAILAGDVWKISVAGNGYDVGDFIVAIVNTPGQTDANWDDFEHNSQQATEITRGTAMIAETSDMNNESTTNDIDIVTPIKFWQGIARFLALPWTWTGKHIFSIAPRLLTANPGDYLRVDGNRDIESRTINDITNDLSLIGAQDLYFPAGFLAPRLSNGCNPVTQVEMATSLFNAQALSFPNGVDTFAQGQFSLPRNWDNGPIQVKLYWMVTTSASGSVTFEVNGGSYADNNALTIALGSAQSVSDAYLGVNTLHITNYTGSITLGNTPTDGDMLVLQVCRKGSTDTLNQPARLLGISIQISTNSPRAV